MSTLKRITGFILTVCLAAAVMAIPDTAAYAKASVASKSVDIMPETQDTDAIVIKYSKGDAELKNIKTNSKNLIAKQTYQYNRTEASQWDTEYPYGRARIGLYAKKTGTYKVTFDVYNTSGKKASSHTVKVFVRAITDFPIKKATFAGKTDLFYGVTTQKSGKFKVTMNKNYKLKKIEVTTYNKKGEEVVKTIKNGAKVTLGNYAYKYEDEYSYTYSDYSYWRYYYSTRLFAETTFRVYYQNTKTKAEGSTSYTLYHMPKN